MTKELTPQRLQNPPTRALELDQIQGDLLIGLQKLFERFIFFQIKDTKLFKAALRTKLTRRITTTRMVHEREITLRDHKKRGNTEPLANVGLNLGFTNEGIRKLTPGGDLRDPAFVAGAEAQAGALGDPVKKNVPVNWLPEFLSGEIDGVLLITGGIKAAIDSEAEHVLGILGAAVSVIHEDMGNILPGAKKGHEHFGWLDGVSQPAIKGLSKPFPGQRVMDAGHFVFGYPGQPTPPPLPWMRNGSFMVFRRFKQLVPEFERFLLDQARKLGMDPVLLGARMVGRWKSGAPLELAARRDDVTLGSDPKQNNNFDFSNDRKQRRCPFGAHIRKTNPREDFAPKSTQAVEVDPHRILRAGIPFGPEVSAEEEEAQTTRQERGLMFVCYQTSIVNQFAFVQTNWANNQKFISPLFVDKKHPDGSIISVGFDPIIGQNSTAGQNRARTTDEPVPNYPSGNVRSKLKEPRDFVVATGGAYFFMPSIEAMKKELSA